jgi:hypothetical protein
MSHDELKPYRDIPPVQIIFSRGVRNQLAWRLNLVRLPDRCLAQESRESTSDGLAAYLMAEPTRQTLPFVGSHSHV